MEKYRADTDIIFYEHEMQKGERVINHLKLTGWEEIKREAIRFNIWWIWKFVMARALCCYHCKNGITKFKNKN